MSQCLRARECKKTEILKKTNKNRFFSRFWFKSGFFSRSGFFQKRLCATIKVVKTVTISLGIKSKDRCVNKIDTLRYCRHVDCTLHGYIQQEEKQNFTILQIQVGFNSIKTVNTFVLADSHTE